MQRDEIITAIEKMRAEGVSDKSRDEFEAIMRRESERRNALADDFHRAIIYCFIVFMRAGYLNKESRNFLRPTKRALMMTVGLLIAVVLEVFLLAALIGFLGFGDYAVILIIFVLLFELGFVVTKGNKLIRGHMGDELGLSRSCTKCSYDLSGLDSVLGDELWVGPEVCPECGHRYPSVV